MATPTTKTKKTPKSRRDPERTREAILEVAGRLLARDGPEGLSVSQVAQIAGVNRGTAYHHFQTREQLLQATTEWVSERLCIEVFGRTSAEDVESVRLDPRQVTENLNNFAMQNPEFGPVWLMQVLTTRKPTSDPFWNLYKAHIDMFVRSDLAQPNIDVEVHAIVSLVGVFLWPVWARAHSRTAKERRELATRFSNEALRMSLHGSLRKEKFPDLKL